MVISIRPLETFAEYHACEALQRRVWVMSDDLEIVPLHILMPVQRHGGLLLGAFDGDELVGFVFGYLPVQRSATLIANLKSKAVNGSAKIEGGGING